MVALVQACEQFNDLLRSGDDDDDDDDDVDDDDDNDDDHAFLNEDLC